MKLIRIYTLTATAGQDAVLEAALVALKAIVTAMDGCEQFIVGREQKPAGLYTVLELWTTVEAHRASGSAIPKSAFGPVMGALSGPPTITDFLQMV